MIKHEKSLIIYYISLSGAKALAQGGKRKHTDRQSNRFAIVAVTVVLVSLALVIRLRVSSLKEKQQQYIEREQSLKQQVEQQEQRAEELDEYRIYVQTKQYIEKIAKEKLGLVKPDEILIKPEGD